MLRPRIIPCLLLQNGGLVKTMQFSQPKYVGDPINAVRIFNEKEADELIIADIDASRNGIAPNLQLIRHLATECRMPLCYAGGVKSVDDIDRIISLGVEKVAISSAAIDNPQLIVDATHRVGSQSIVFVLDVKKNPINHTYRVFTHNGTRDTGMDPIQLSVHAEKLGAGEILINSIDRDGLQTGYDLDLISLVRKEISIPMTALGGCGSLADIEHLIKIHHTIGAAAGSFFIFKGKFRAVLINYPSRQEKDEIFKRTNSDENS